MNGATPLPPRRMSTLASSKTTMMGVSHHFLLCNAKSRNWAMKPGCLPPARLLELVGGFLVHDSMLSKITGGIAAVRTPAPVAGRLAVEAAMERVVSAEP
jgi:hypothetical protein